MNQYFWQYSVSSMQQYPCKHRHWLCILYTDICKFVFLSEIRGEFVSGIPRRLHKETRNHFPQTFTFTAPQWKNDLPSPLLENSAVRYWLILYLLYKSSTFLYRLFHRVSPTSVLFFCTSLSNSGTLYCGSSYVAISVACIAFIVVFLVSK